MKAIMLYQPMNFNITLYLNTYNPCFFHYLCKDLSRGFVYKYVLFLALLPFHADTNGWYKWLEHYSSTYCKIIIITGSFIICSEIPWIACHVKDPGSKSQSRASAQVSRLECTLTVQASKWIQACLCVCHKLNSKIPILTCAVYLHHF